MRKIFFSYSTGYAGMDGHEVLEFDDDVSVEELDLAAWEGAVANAEMYGVYNACEYEDSITEEELDSECYSYDISGDWEDYDPEKHDGYIN